MALKPTYVYLFVRNDIHKAQQIIQVAHAVAMADRSESYRANMVLFEVRNEVELQMVNEHLEANGIFRAMFYEPDLPGYTAIATEPLKGDSRALFKRYKMMK